MLIDTAKINSSFCPMLTGLSYGTTYYVFYDDPDLLGGAVSYQYSTTKADALNHAGRFFAGSIVTPVSGGADTIGDNNGGAGAQTGFKAILYATAGNATVSANEYDGNTSTYGAQTASFVPWYVYNFTNPSNLNYTALTLKTRSSVTVSGTTTLQYSLNGGSSWTNIYSTSANRALTVDSVAIPVGTDISQIRVGTATGFSGTWTINFYEAWLEAQG